jgi:hypothetical protein
MTHRLSRPPFVRVVVALSFLLAAGCCATVKHAQTTEPAPAAPSIPVVESPAPPPPIEPLRPASARWRATANVASEPCRVRCRTDRRDGMN